MGCLLLMTVAVGTVVQVVLWRAARREMVPQFYARPPEGVGALVAPSG
ncbi:hypothetical protein [Streptomyces sp. NPDC056191]